MERAFGSARASLFTTLAVLIASTGRFGGQTAGLVTGTFDLTSRFAVDTTPRQLAVPARGSVARLTVPFKSRPGIFARCLFYRPTQGTRRVHVLYLPARWISSRTV